MYFETASEMVRNDLEHRAPHFFWGSVFSISQEGTGCQTSKMMSPKQGAPIAIPNGTPDRIAGVTFPGGGEMGERIRAFDWSKTTLGRPEVWPQNLKSAVAICLDSRTPIVIWWDSEQAIQFYNDAYISFLGPTKHPQFLGRPIIPRIVGDVSAEPCRAGTTNEFIFRPICQIELGVGHYFATGIVSRIGFEKNIFIILLGLDYSSCFLPTTDRYLLGLIRLRVCSAFLTCG